jgi:hypothetical protein
MRPKGRRVIAVLLASLVAGALSGPALSAAPFHKCNSGNGNGSEPVLNDCDPGNSGGNNSGGD